MVAATKTFYLGAMAIQEKRHMLNMAAKADMMGIRPPDTAKQASRSQGFPGPDHPQFSAFQKMGPDDKLRFLKSQEEVVNLRGKAQKIEATIKNLSNNPSGWEKFKAVFQGGIQAKIGKLDKQVEDIEKQINNRNENVTKLVDKYEPKIPIPTELQQNRSQTTGQKQNVEQSLELSEQEAHQLLQSLNKLSGEPNQVSLSLNEQEAGELLKSLNKLSNHPKESRRDSLKLNDQEADELLKALDKLSPEQLQQVQTKSETIQITDEQLDQLINELKSMDVAEPSESVSSKLHMNHISSGSSTQKQRLGERPKLRDAFPELVHDQGQKKEGPKQGNFHD